MAGLLSLRQFRDSLTQSSRAAKYSSWVDTTTYIVDNTNTKLSITTFPNINPGTKLYIIFNSSYGYPSKPNIKPLFEATYEGEITDANGILLAKFWVPYNQAYYYTRPMNLSSFTFMI